MLQHPNIDPILIQLGPLAVHWYGVCYLAAFTIIWWLAVRRSSKPITTVLSAEEVGDMIFYAVIGVVVGGRVGYMVFYHSAMLLEYPLSLFFIWQGGMAFHGGLLGVCLAIVLFARRYHKSVGELADFIAPMVPIGLGFGRLGNFIGQELWGRPTTLPWGMIFPADPEGIARHPSQLYQFALEGVLLFIILHWFIRHPRPRWSTSGMFLLIYGLFRFSVEFVRAPDMHIGFDAFGWLTRGQLLSLPMVIAGGLLIFYAYHRHPLVTKV